MTDDGNVEWLRTVPQFVAGITAITTLALTYGLTGQRKYLRQLDRVLATLDKLPDDDRRFWAIRAKLRTEGANAAAKLSASLHIGVPVSDYAWCLATCAVASVFAWANTELDPTLSPGFFQRNNQVLNWILVAMLLVLMGNRLLAINRRRAALTRKYRRQSARRLPQIGPPGPHDAKD